MRRFAVIPTRDRPELYAKAVEAIRPQIDTLITVAHLEGKAYSRGVVVPYDKPEANISEMWNLGLQAAEALSFDKPYLVAILNDDTEVPPYWFDHLEEVMQVEGTVLGSGLRADTPGRRLCGYAFVVRGNTIKADPRWAWWVSDDHLVREANNVGGWSWIPTLVVKHQNQALPAEHPLQIQSHRDVEIWFQETGEIL